MTVFRASDDWLAEYAMRRKGERPQPAPKPPDPAKIWPVGRPAKRHATSLPAPLEADVLAAILAALQMHPDVALHWRANTAAFEIDGRYVRAGFPGCSDVLGMLKTGHFLAIEAKRSGERPTEDQVAFLGKVARNGGCAFVAWSVDDVFTAIKEFLRDPMEAT